jgi:hypothetical protein
MFFLSFFCVLFFVRSAPFCPLSAINQSVYVALHHKGRCNCKAMALQCLCYQLAVDGVFDLLSFLFPICLSFVYSSLSFLHSSFSSFVPASAPLLLLLLLLLLLVGSGQPLNAPLLGTAREEKESFDPFLEGGSANEGQQGISNRIVGMHHTSLHIPPHIICSLHL